MNKRIVVGISGASGILYGIVLLQALRTLGFETHVVISRAGRRTMKEETDYSFDDLKALSSHLYPIEDIGAAISSGSFQTLGMIVAPCSIRTAAEIATGVTSNLITRAADVALKERRRLVLMVRETPLHVGHLRMLTNLAEMGAIIAPPVPAFYTRPHSIQNLIDHTVGRMLDLFGIHNELAYRWGEDPATERNDT